MKTNRLFCFILLCLFVVESSCSQIEDHEYYQSTPAPLSDSIVNIAFECSYSKYMTLQPAQSSAQASACYGDYFVQGYNFNSCITIYNLEMKSCLGTIDIPAPAASTRTHVNTMNFGSQRYSPNDYFPLLYISSGYSTNEVFYIYVYRLVKETKGGQELFFLSLVQTISLYGFENWTEGVIDNENNRLFVIHYPQGYYCYAQYDMPRLEEGDISIHKNDCRKDVWLERIPHDSRNQGQIYVDGKILLVTGVPSANEVIAFISIDTEKEERDFIINLAEVGLVNRNNPKDNTFEPEGVIIYNGQLMICYRTALYSFSFKKKDEEPTNIMATHKDVSPSDKNFRDVYDLLANKHSGIKGIIIMQGNKGCRKNIIR